MYVSFVLFNLLNLFNPNLLWNTFDEFLCQKCFMFDTWIKILKKNL